MSRWRKIALSDTERGAEGTVGDPQLVAAIKRSVSLLRCFQKGHELPEENAHTALNDTGIVRRCILHCMLADFVGHVISKTKNDRKPNTACPYGHSEI